MSNTDYIQYKLNQPKRANSAAEDLSNTSCPLKTANCDSLNDPKERDACKGEKKSTAAEIAKSMGVTACQASGSGQHDIVEAKVGPFGLLGSGKNEKIRTSYASLGCETLSIIANEMNMATEKVSCTLKKSSATITKSFSAGNSVEILADGGIVDIDCGDESSVDSTGFTIDQKINLKIVDLNQISNEEKSQIETTVKNAITNVADAVLNSTQGAAAPPPNAKSVINTCNNIKNTDIKNTITENMTKISMTVDTSNKVRIVAKNGGQIRLKGKKCAINQDILIDIASTNIVSSTANHVLTELFDNIGNNTTKTDITSVSKGLESISSLGSGSLGLAVIVIIIIVYFMIK